MNVIWIKSSNILNIKIWPPAKKEKKESEKESLSERLWFYELGKGKASEICWLHGEKMFQEDANIPSGPCASSVVPPSRPLKLLRKPRSMPGRPRTPLPASSTSWMTCWSSWVSSHGVLSGLLRFFVPLWGSDLVDSKQVLYTRWGLCELSPDVTLCWFKKGLLGPSVESDLSVGA